MGALLSNPISVVEVSEIDSALLIPGTPCLGRDGRAEYGIHALHGISAVAALVPDCTIAGVRLNGLGFLQVPITAERQEQQAPAS